MDVYDSPAYGPVRCLWQACSSPTEAHQLYRMLHSERLSHIGVLKVYEVTAPQEHMGSVWVGLVVEAGGQDLWTELVSRHAQGQYWREEQILHVFRCLVEVLNYAEQAGKWHLGISPWVIYSSGSSYKLSPFFSNNIQNQVQQCFSYLSPELKVMTATGQWTAYDPVKADVYSVGVVLLSMALLSVPDLLDNLGHLEENTEILLRSVERYPTLQWYLGRLLAVKPCTRPSFKELETEFHSSSQPLPAAVSSCAVCLRPITDTVWVQSLPNDLQFLEHVASSCCSYACLTRFKELALEDTSSAKEFAQKAVDWGVAGTKQLYAWLKIKLL